MSFDTIPNTHIKGWKRNDGRIGIRNCLLVVYLVECAHFVCKKIARSFDESEVQVIGFSGCFPNDYAQHMIEQLCTHQNVGAILLVSLGCENFKKNRLMQEIENSGRPVHLISIQNLGGTENATQTGRTWVSKELALLHRQDKVRLPISDLVIGTICGGSDGTSGITGNPATGRAFDLLIQKGATCIFEETGELIGCEQVMAQRACTDSLSENVIEVVQKAARYYDSMGYGSFSQGNADGGLSTIEEKSLGAYAKSGTSMINGIIKPGERPPKSGLYLLDVVPDDAPKFGYPNINDNAEIIELISCGAHLVIFVTGRGSVVGSAISPVMKVCANPETFRKMEGDMDINAGKILTLESTLKGVGQEIVDQILLIADGKQTKSERQGHFEFVLTYKSDTLVPTRACG